MAVHGQTDTDTTTGLASSHSGGAPLPELTDSLPPPAGGVGRFLDPLIGFAPATAATDADIAFEAMNNAHACTLVTGIASNGTQPVAVHSLDDVFETEMQLFDLLDDAPLGRVSIEDDMTGQTTEVPLFECKAAAKLREIMAVDGIVPLMCSKEGTLIIALRTDADTLQRFNEIADTGLKELLGELKTLSPSLHVDSDQCCFIPVNLKTYDTISASITSADFRARRAIESCDAHFVNSAGLADLLEEAPRLVPLSRACAGSNPIEELIRTMHFSPFIPLEANDAQANERPNGGKSSATPSRTDAVSVFDRPSQTKNMPFLLERIRRDGFLPIRIERGEKNQPIAVVGFRAHEEGSNEKRRWERVVGDASRFAQTLASIFPDHFDKSFSVRDVALVPIPGHYFEHLSSQLGDPIARKNSYR